MVIEADGVGTFFLSVVSPFVVGAGDFLITIVVADEKLDEGGDEADLRMSGEVVCGMLTFIFAFPG